MSAVQEPIFDVAQLAHVELLTPKPEETVKFFTDILGMSITGRSGQSVYLRAYEETYHHSLKITEAKYAGLGHAAWRTISPQALQRRVEAVEASGLGKGWIEGDLGHGEAYQFTTPDGHLMELFYDVEYYEKKENEASKLLNRPTKRPNKGVPVRRIDHINLLTADPGKNTEFMVDKLGFRLREQIRDKGKIVGSWISVSPLVHEIAFMQEPNRESGKIHHLCYWYGVPQNLYDVAELCRENDIFIEVPPNKHGISQAVCMYVYEPGGTRIELFGDTGYLIFDPTWEPVIWEMEEVPGTGDTWIGTAFPESWWTRGTPITETKIAQS